MKKLLLLLLLQLAVLTGRAQNCGTFTNTTVCAQSPSGQQVNCCRCVGSQPQNANFCVGTPINKGLIFLIIGGVGIGTYFLRAKFIESGDETSLS